MSSITFNRSVKVSGVLTNADSVPTIQIVRLDTSAVVVATTSTGVTNPSTGNYTYTLTPVVDGVTYRSTWTFIVSGQTITTQKDITAATTSPAWDLADYQDVQDIIANPALRIIDDPDDDGAENLDFVQRCGDYSDAYIYGRMKAFGYATPLTGMDAGTVILMSYISAVLVIDGLNQARALLSSNPSETDKIIAGWRADADGQLLSIGLGTLAIVADRATDYDAAATAISGRLDDNTINANTLANPVIPAWQWGWPWRQM